MKLLLVKPLVVSPASVSIDVSDAGTPDVQDPPEQVGPPHVMPPAGLGAAHPRNAAQHIEGGNVEPRAQLQQWGGVRPTGCTSTPPRSTGQSRCLQVGRGGAGVRSVWVVVLVVV